MKWQMLVVNSGTLNSSRNALLLLCIILVLLIIQFNNQIVVGTGSQLCETPSDCSLREWLVKLQGEASTLGCTAVQLESSITLLNGVNSSHLALKRQSQLEKVRKVLSNLEDEIEIINFACSTKAGPFCNITIPTCDPKCTNCTSQDNCSVCLGNWQGISCSTCKSGWSGSNCTIPLCDSKCLNCSSPSNCSVCSGNYVGSNCSQCKIGWSGIDCASPVCDSKCLNCSSPSNCSVCSGNWAGFNCSQCKTGWSEFNCSVPICNAKCTSCASPSNCTVCSGNWAGSNCSQCKTGWSGVDCASPVCDTKCTTCASPGNCSVCSGNWIGLNCSQCKSGWTGVYCNITLCDSTCQSRISSLAGSSILTTSQQERFVKEIMNRVSGGSFTLLYRASRDGFSPSVYYSRVVGQAPRIVLLKATTGAIFGGFTSIRLQTGVQLCESDPSAFLFSVISSTNVERYTVLTQTTGPGSYYYQNGAYCSVAGVSGYGPLFSSNPYAIWSSTDGRSGSCHSLCQYYCHPSVSAYGDETSYLAGTSSFTYADLEFYLVS